jgi:hypothetical protein
MKGYVQRLIRGVRQTTPSVHPTVGSVYSPSKRPDPSERQTLESMSYERSAATPTFDPISTTRVTSHEDAVTVPQIVRKNDEPRRESDKTRTPPEDQFANQRHIAEKPSASPLPLIMPIQSMAESKPGAEPLDNHFARAGDFAGNKNSLPMRRAGVSAGEGVSRDKLAPSADIGPLARESVPPSKLGPSPITRAITRPTVDPRDRNEEPGKTTTPPAGLPAAIVKRLYQPLLNADVSGSQPAQGKILAHKVDAAPASKSQTRDSLRRSVPAAREEIQIHIGRIEVTALPPGPARATAPTARKGLSLEEYLKRGDRRVQ